MLEQIGDLMTESHEKHETLGKSVIPEEYSILIKPDLKSFTFEGEEEIAADAKLTNEITLNSNGLKIANASVKGETEQNARVSYDTKKERVTLKLNNKVKGRISITLKFSGKIGDSLNGLYRSSYMQDNKKKYILTTQFEAPDARRAFPCFDEPEFKAVFKISLLVDRNLECISNMPISSEKNKGSKKLVMFEPTPRMSTYLVYIGIGDYDFVEDSLHGIKIRAITTKGKKEMARIPLAYAKKFVSFYEQYFGIKYPLPKLDLIAIPDFAAGAMENWGAITFREIDMLCKESSPISVKQGVAITVAHELAHQWFGDLVTMKWWNDLWLNESFATFMSYKAVAHCFPEWRMQEHYIEDTISVALSEDSLKSTHPIRVHVNTPGEISSIFDAISYEKGGSVLNMLEDYVTPEVFRKGLHAYLKAHAYANAEAQDLWDAISHAAGSKKISEVANAWIEKPGYPVVIANQKKGSIALKQKRFLISGLGKGTWPIPLHYLGSKGEKRKLMENEQEAVQADWIKLNYMQKGVYRAMYKGELLDKMLSVMKTRLNGVEAWGIENDMFAFVRSGMVKAEAYLDFVKRNLINAEYPANSSILSHLIWLGTVLYGSKLYESRVETMRQVANSILNSVGLDAKPGEPTISKQTRSRAIICLGLLGDSRIADFARKKFETALKTGKIDPDIKEAVYEVAAWNGTKEDFDKIKSRYAVEETPDEKMRLLKALAFFRGKELVNEAFAFSDSPNVRLQDKHVIPALSTYNPEARAKLSSWTFASWKKLEKLYPEGTMMLPRFVANLAVLKTKKDLGSFDAFFKRKENMRDDIKPEVAKARERIIANIKFAELNGV